MKACGQEEKKKRKKKGLRVTYLAKAVQRLAMPIGVRSYRYGGKAPEEILAKIKTQRQRDGQIGSRQIGIDR